MGWNRREDRLGVLAIPIGPGCGGHGRTLRSHAGRPCDGAGLIPVRGKDGSPPPRAACGTIRRVACPAFPRTTPNGGSTRPSGAGGAGLPATFDPVRARARTTAQGSPRRSAATRGLGGVVDRGSSPCRNEDRSLRACSPSPVESAAIGRDFPRVKDLAGNAATSSSSNSRSHASENRRLVLPRVVRERALARPLRRERTEATPSSLSAWGYPTASQATVRPASPSVPTGTARADPDEGRPGRPTRGGRLPPRGWASRDGSPRAVR